MKIDELFAYNPKAVRLIGYDDCIVGHCIGCNQEEVLLYDKSDILKKLMSDGMSEDDAEDYFNYNVLGSSIVINGAESPLFLINRVV
jgi:hypothetical protein